MHSIQKRRLFIKSSTLALAGIGLGVHGFAKALYPNLKGKTAEGLRVGIIGLDTSHSIAFTKALNNPAAGPEFNGFKVVAAYPFGSKEIKSSFDRIAPYTLEMKNLGIEITDSIADLLSKVDFVLLETNDGRLHLEQALEIIKSGKRFFIDKPIAASLKDAAAIFAAAEKANVGVFSSSSLRYTSGAQSLAAGKLGKILGADTYSPCELERTHPDLFWYGIHGVESLFTLMGTGCKEVVRVSTANTEIVTATWNDGRVGTFRGTRNGKSGYGGTVFAEKGIAPIGDYEGYNPLLAQITNFFKTGIAPVSASETLEICAFMEAADESKKRGGAAVSLDSMFKKASLKR